MRKQSAECGMPNAELRVRCQKAASNNAGWRDDRAEICRPLKRAGVLFVVVFHAVNGVVIHCIKDWPLKP
ncbi:MAG TPA: hypothetical protein PKD24_16265 [Pyrinomonadaceae bacterium]|nr:hypothetical protein [Pyrinomonadaceae bacterium]